MKLLLFAKVEKLGPGLSLEQTLAIRTLKRRHITKAVAAVSAQPRKVLKYDDFEFTDVNELSRKTKCIEVAMGPPGLAPAIIKFEVFVPKQLGSGRVISASEAQQTAHSVASLAAQYIIDRVNAHLLDPIT